eukprot:scaffold84_cov163-Amphora_coffeaeformis.AAC.23
MTQGDICGTEKCVEDFKIVCESNADGTPKKVWMVKDAACGTEVYVNIPKIGEFKDQQYECGLCDESCPLDGPICERRGGNSVTKVWITKDSKCGTETCVEVAKVGEFKEKGYDCGLCSKMCPIGSPPCDVGGGGEVRKIWMYQPSGGQCTPECIDIASVDDKIAKDYECGLCPDSCPLDGPVCELYPNGSTKRVWMSSVLSNGSKCQLDCIDLDKVADFKAGDYVCGKCPPVLSMKQPSVMKIELVVWSSTLCPTTVFFLATNNVSKKKKFSKRKTKDTCGRCSECPGSPPENPDICETCGKPFSLTFEYTADNVLVTDKTNLDSDLERTKSDWIPRELDPGLLQHEYQLYPRISR